MILEKEQNFISAIVYVQNDAHNIETFLTMLNTTLKSKFKKYEIICVNDGSADNSGDIIRNLEKKDVDCPICLINMGFYQGIEMAMNAGIDMAIGDFVYEFDCNVIDYDPQTILDIYNRSLQGYDIVVATNNNKKRLSSKLFYRLFNRSANTQYKIGTETFRILSRRAINRVHSLSKTIPYRKALYANCGLKMDTVTYKSTCNESQKLLDLQKSARYETAINTLILFTNAGYKVSIALTLVMILATLGIGIYTILIFLLGQPVAGFTTTMLAMTFSFFGVFVILTIIIKYLSVLVDLVFKKQKYIIESIEKINK